MGDSYQPKYPWYAHPAIMIYATLWLMVLLVVGTLAQKGMGLYLAQQVYFSSWFFWAGPLPLPGGRLVLAVIGTSLVLKLVRERSWGLQMLGVNIVHLGAVLLLMGGFLTAYFSEEGSLWVSEGETSATVRDYHDLELALIDTSATSHDDVVAYAAGWLYPGEVITPEGTALRITVKAFARNCRLVQRKAAPESSLRGMAERFELVALGLDPQGERNRAGVLLDISGVSENTGSYLLVEHMPVEQTLSVGERSFKLVLRKEQRRLPFAIELLDFERVVYPGTDTPKSFRSVVHVVEENGLKRRAVIQMNEPLRHRGYTLYQSSFTPGQVETSVLAVVQNFGRVFPYLSSLVMCAGLLLHLLVFLPMLIQRQRKPAGSKRVEEAAA